MTGKQSAVLWLGLLLIITRLFTTDQWDELWGTLTTHTSSSNNEGPGTTLPGTNITVHPLQPGQIKAG